MNGGILNGWINLNIVSIKDIMETVFRKPITSIYV